MHVNWGFWGAVLGVATLAEVMNDSPQGSDDLARDLILLAGYNDRAGFIDRLGRRLLPYGWSHNQFWDQARFTAYRMQDYKEGATDCASDVQRFRDLCRVVR